MAEQGSVHYKATLDYSELDSAVEKVRRLFRDLDKDIQRETKSLDEIFKASGELPGKLFSGLESIGGDSFSKMSEKAQQLAKGIEQDALAVRQLDKVQGELNNSYEAGAVSLQDYLTAQARLSVLREELGKSIRQQQQALQEEVSGNKLAEDSIVSLQAKVALLSAEYMQLSRAQREGTEGKALIDNLRQTQTELNNAQVTMNRYAGLTNRQFNGLHMSVQQIARELPAITMGPNMFFMALSNNLPIFIDEVQRARREYDALVASGKKGVPIIKQIASAFFSWQTAVVAGITLMTAYGDAIIEWTASLFEGKQAMSDVSDMERDLAAATAAHSEKIGEQISAYRRLQNEYEDTKGSAEQLDAWIANNENAFKDVGLAIRDAADAENAFVENTDAVIQAMVLRAKTTSAMELAAEAYTKMVDAALKKERIQTGRMTTWESVWAQIRASLSSGTMAMNPAGFPESYAQVLLRDIAKQDDKFDRFKAEGDWYTEQIRKLEDELKSVFKDAGLSMSEEAERGLSDRLADLIAKLTLDAEQARIDAMAEGLPKELAQINYNYSVRAKEIRKREQELKELQGGTLTAEQNQDFGALNMANAKERMRAIQEAMGGQIDTEQLWRDKAAQWDEEIKAEEEAWNEYLREYGNFREHVEATARYYDQRMAEASTEGERQMVQAEMASVLGAMKAQSDAIVADLESRTVEELTRMIGDTQEALAAAQAKFQSMLSTAATSSGGETGSDVTALREKIAYLNEQITILQEKLRAAQSTANSGNWEGFASAIGSIADVSNVAADITSEFNEEAGRVMKNISNIITGIAQLGNAIVAIKTVQQSISSAISGVMGGITAGLGIALQAVSMIINSIQQTKQIMREAREAAHEYQLALEELARSQGLVKYDTIFGTDSYGKARAQWEQGKKIIGEIDKEIKDHRADYQKYSQSFRGLELFGENEVYRGDNLIISDPRKKRWKRTGKKQYLVQTFDLNSLYDENGGFSPEKMGEFVKWYESFGEDLSESDKETVENIIADWEDYQEAMEGVKEYLSSLFGELAGNIATSMREAFESSGEAVVDLTEHMTDLKRAVADSVVQSYLMELLFSEEFNKQVTDLMMSGDIAGAVNLINEQLGKVPEARQAAEELYAALGLTSEALGETAEKAAEAETGIQASQDSVNVMNGRLLAIQGHTFSIREFQRSIKENVTGIAAEIRTLVGNNAAMLERLVGIESNTWHLVAIDSNIQAMGSQMLSISRDIASMKRDGITMKR